MEGSQQHGDPDPPRESHSPPIIERKKSRRLSVLKSINPRTDDGGQSSGSVGGSRGILHRRPTLGTRKKEKHIRIEERSPQRPNPLVNGANIYMGSYGLSPSNSRPISVRSLRTTRSSRTPRSPRSPRQSVVATPRHSLSNLSVNNQAHLEDLDYLLRDLHIHMETYGIQETRDGFFDATFFRPPKTDKAELMRIARHTLPASFGKQHRLSLSGFFPRQWR